MEQAVTKKRFSLRVLFVDDEQNIADLMRSELPRMGHTATIRQTASSAIEAINNNTFDAAIVDLRMPGGSGWDVIDHLRQHSPETEYVISTGHGSMDDAIRGIRMGAYDFLPKPVSLFEIASVLDRIGEKKALQNKAIALESRLERAEGRSDLIGTSAPMMRVHKLIEKIAPTDSAVLILGETGTGKEMVARRIHEMSDRRNEPFVAVNCGALPENLVESEFFGHRKGAFTGADVARTGLFEVANGGTLFLDELGELDKSMQVKLLRFLESGEVRRVGENEPFHVDVRIVCATNRELESMVAEGSFREDLFFRVNTFEIHLPPLRERLDDIPQLARHLITRHLKRDRIPDDFLPAETIQVLQTHHWSGNIRELSNVLEHAVILSDGQKILPADLPRSVTKNLFGKLDQPAKSVAETVPEKPTLSIVPQPKITTLREMEQQMILDALNKYEGDKPKAAKELGIALKTLYNRLSQIEAFRDSGTSQPQSSHTTASQNKMLSHESQRDLEGNRHAG
ncbi:MAG: sigma-54-dependent Fis family transcriptional regulator [Planctomyces sp.]|nr:sigma-54-dependent Fis family transcriptional regulator [Planctomyces sp.]